MKIKKNLLTAILISTLAVSGTCANAQMSPQASVLYQEACSAEHQQDLKEAISKLEQAIEISGGEAMLYTKLAGIYAEIDEYDKALANYQKVIAINPDDAFIYISVGSIYESQGKYKQALEAYNKALDIFPEYKYNYFNIGNVQYQLGNYKEAVKNYSAFLETYSGHSEARENLANSYLAVKDFSNAEKQYSLIYDKNPDSFKDQYGYGISLLNTNQPDKAIAFLEKAIEIDADNNAAHLGLAQAYQDLGRNDVAYQQYQIVLKNVPNLNNVRLDYANLLANMDKNTEALEQYNMYIKAYPEDVKGYIAIAETYQDLKNYDKAIENFLTAQSKDPDNIETKKSLANCYHNKKDYDDALKYYDEILEVQPDDFNVKFNRALALHALKQYDKAITSYKELLNIKNEKSIKENLNNALVSQGHELVEDKDYKNAISIFKEAIKGGYNDGYVYYGLARAYKGLGENSKASDNYEKAISINPEKTLYSAEYSDFISSLYSSQINVQTLEQPKELPSINLSMDNQNDVKKADSKQQTSSVAIKKNEDFIAEGDKNYKSNNYDAAVKNYQDALQLVPDDEVTLLKIGNIYKLKEDNTKAINFYQKAIIVNPDYTDGWFNLGLAYANENNLIESEKSFEKVIELDSDYNFGYAYYALAMALEHQGKKSEAIKNYKTFIKHNNDKDLINSVQEKIKELQ
ncbi:tetratricopeptide repeat protein [bacterium]|nr:tetratricopeptide repeat protein [bacterium]